MAELIKNNSTEVVSFDQYKPKITTANSAILKFLKKSYEEKRIIRREDIYNLYIDWKFGKEAKKIPYESYKGKWEWSTHHSKEVYYREYFTVYLTREEWLSRWMKKQACINWFKTNLGAVILKGKLVVLPIIEV